MRRHGSGDLNRGALKPLLVVPPLDDRGAFRLPTTCLCAILVVLPSTPLLKAIVEREAVRAFIVFLDVCLTHFRSDLFGRCFSVSLSISLFCDLGSENDDLGLFEPHLPDISKPIQSSRPPPSLAFLPSLRRARNS